MTDISISAAERFELLDLVNRYSTGIDTRNWDLFRTVFHNDAEVDFGFACWTGADEFTTFMRETHDPAGRTLHRMSNTTITGTAPLTARTYGDAIVLESDNANGTDATAWYDDTFTRSASHGLQILRRRVHMIAMVAHGPNQVAGI